MIAAVHGTVNGLVLVGLAEGILLGHRLFRGRPALPRLVGAMTGVAAVIPFAAPVVYSLAGLYLFAVGNTLGGDRDPGRRQRHCVRRRPFRAART